MDDEQRTTQKFRRKEFEEIYLRAGDEELRKHLGMVYRCIDKCMQQRNPAHWSNCCNCLLRGPDYDSLNHPRDKVIKVKELMASMKCTDEESFIDEMIQRLPRNDDDHVLFPMVNMAHPTKENSTEKDDSSEDPTKEAYLTDYRNELLLRLSQQEELIRAQAETNQAIQKELDQKLNMMKLKLEVDIISPGC